MSAARLVAAACAVVAIGLLTVPVVLGAELGWVVEVRGGRELSLESYDVRGELPWMSVLTVGVLAGAALAARRPRHPVPWLLMAVGLGFLAFPTVVSAVAYAGRSEVVPAWTPYVAWIGNWIWLVGYVGGVYLLLLFPDGRPMSPRWGRVARGGAVYIGAVWILLAVWPMLEAAPDLDNPFGVEALRGLEPAFTLLVLGIVILQFLAVVCLVLRFVRSRGVERAQMKWMALAAATVGLLLAAGPLDLPRWVQAIPTAFIIAAIVVAVSRYRLFEIDRIISRTVSYALLTVLLAGVYATGVIGLGWVGRGLGLGAGSDLVVAASTLAVAALFGPLRRRVQGAVDRRFNRARYDAARTVEEFAQRLRDQVDVGAIRAELGSATAAAVQPVGAHVWLLGDEDGARRRAEPVS